MSNNILFLYIIYLYTYIKIKVKHYLQQAIID